MKDVKEEGKGVVVSIYFDPIVLTLLDEKSKSMERSRSWMVNFILREPLGVPPELPSRTEVNK